jgi:hypothetical protein
VSRRRLQREAGRQEPDDPDVEPTTLWGRVVAWAREAHAIVSALVLVVGLLVGAILGAWRAGAFWQREIATYATREYVDGQLERVARLPGEAAAGRLDDHERRLIRLEEIPRRLDALETALRDLRSDTTTRLDVILSRLPSRTTP